MKAKNILFIIPEMSMGGAQRSLSKISRALSPFYNVSIVVFNRNHETAAMHNEKVLSLNVNSGSNPIIKFIAFCTRIVRLRKLKKRLGIDIAISFLEGADYVNILSRRTEKVVLSIRGSKVHDENMHRENFFLRSYIIRLLYRKADAIVCVNNGIAKELTEYYGMKDVSIHVIYNFYDIDEIQQLANFPLDSQFQRLYKDQVIVMSGRLAAEKGHAFVIKLFAELKHSNPGLRLVLIGDGPQRENIINLCVSLCLKVDYKNVSVGLPDVLITGEQLNVFNHLKNSTLYILNSSSEGFPNGLAEAMAAGLPVLAADCPYGPREILSLAKQRPQSENAEFVEYGILLPLPTFAKEKAVQKAWLSATSAVLSSSQVRVKYSELGLKRVREFSKTKILHQWREVLEA